MTEAILVMIVVIASGGSMTTERVSSLDECKRVAKEVSNRSPRHVVAYCVPTEPLLKLEKQNETTN